MAEIGVSAISDAYLGRTADRYAAIRPGGADSPGKSAVWGGQEGNAQKASDASPLSAKNIAEKPNSTAINELTEEEKKEVQKLKQRDTEVHQHEQAHLSVAGRYARGGAKYTFTRGPDGRQYATGGEVSLDVSPTRTPQGTITKAGVIKAAALAPAEPSSQDRAVAAAAGRMENEARAELAKQRIEDSIQQRDKTNPMERAATAQPSEQNPLTPESRVSPPKQNPFTLNDFEPSVPRGYRQLDIRA